MTPKFKVGDKLVNFNTYYGPIVREVIDITNCSKSYYMGYYKGSSYHLSFVQVEESFHLLSDFSALERVIYNIEEQQ